MKKFNSEEFNKLYEDFSLMFKEEGDVYGNLLESITSDYKHKVIPTTMHKTIIVQILDMAAVEYFKNEIEIIEEPEIIKEYGFR